MWKLQSQVGKQEREKEAWFDQTLIPSGKSHVDGDPSIGAPYPTHTQINARLACFWWLFGIFQKEEEDDGSARLNHWNWYTKAPLCGFTSEDLKKHEMQTKGMIKLSFRMSTLLRYRESDKWSELCIDCLVLDLERRLTHCAFILWQSGWEKTLFCVEARGIRNPRKSARKKLTH
jgi:hypothetical protein